MTFQLPHWRMAGAATVFVLAGSSAVALAMHNEPSGAYQAGSPAPVRRSPGAVHSAAEKAGRALLAQAVAACRSTAFSGIQAFRSFGPGGATVWLAEIWHRPGGQLVADPVSAGQGETSTSAGVPGPGVSMALSARQLTLLQAGYVLDYAGRGSADGRAADLVTVDRPDGSLAARYWLDRKTRLPLRRQLFDGHARIVSEVSVGGLRTGPAALAGMPAAGRQPWARQLGKREIATLRARGWPLPGQLPGGLILVDASATGTAARQVVAASYSDGLSVVSMFVQRGKLPARMLGWQRLAIGGRNAYAIDPDDQTIAWSGGGYVFTLLADAPAAVVDQAVSALPQDSEPGFWGRIGRGFRRLAAWANPFR